MAKLKLELLGVPEAIAAFKGLPPIAKQELGEATRSTVMAMAAAARQRVRVRTGALRDAIDYSYSPQTGVGLVGVRGVHDGRPRDFDRWVEKFKAGEFSRLSPAVYARFLEFGTVRRPAFPFMTAAAESQREAYLQRCRAAGPKIEARAASTSGARFL